MVKYIDRRKLDAIAQKSYSPVIKEQATGRRFEAQLHTAPTVSEARQRFEEYSDSAHKLANLPQVMDIRIDKTIDDPATTVDITCQSEEFAGFDVDGRFYAKGTKIYVVNHGKPLISPWELHSKTKRVSKSISGVGMFLDKMISETNIVPIEELGARKSGNYAVVMPHNSLLSGGIFLKKEILENPLMVARAGGVDRLAQYIDKLSSSEMYIEQSQGDPTQPSVALLVAEKYGRYSGIRLQNMATKDIINFLSYKEKVL